MAVPVSNDDLFKRSTQWRSWTKTASSLEECRSVTHQRAKNELIKNVHIMEKDEFLENIPNQEECLKLVRYYLVKCKELGQFLKIRDDIIITCMIYLSRFFLEKSILEYDIKGVMYTCLFLGCKVQDCMISPERMCQLIPNLSRDNLLKYEWDILKTLKFQLMVHEPNRCVWGFFLDFQSLWMKSERLDKMLDLSKWWCLESFKSDVQFKYTPSQVALACMYLSDDIMVEKYLEHRGELETLPLIKSAAEEIKQVQSEQLDIKEAKDITLKVNFAKDPEKFLNKIKKRKLN